MSHSILNDAEIERLKKKYSEEMRNDADNPIKLCMKLIFESAICKDNHQKLELSFNLSRFLVGEKGILNLFLAVVDFDTSSQKVTTHHQRFLAISNIITCLPKLCLPAQEYVEVILRQLQPFLASENEKYSSLASIIVKSMRESPHSKNGQVERIILRDLMESLTNSDALLTVEQAIILTENLINNNYSSKSLSPAFANLFQMYSQLHQQSFITKQSVRRCLVGIITSFSPGQACCLLERVLLHSPTSVRYEISLETERNICIIPLDSEEQLARLPESQLVSVVLDLLEGCESDDLILEFFFHFQESVWTNKVEQDRKLYASLIEPLLIDAVGEKSTKFDIAALITKNMDRCSNLILRTLVNYVSFLNTKSTVEDFRITHSLVAPTVSCCISILEVLATLSTNLELLHSECGPILRSIKGCLEAESERRISARQILDDVNSLLSRLDDKSSKDKNIGELNDNSVSEAEVSNLLRDLNDPLEPVRVHSLVRFKQLVLANDRHVLDQIPRLFRLLASSLADKEPYVFLAAINLISEMTTRKSSELLVELTSLYRCTDLSLQHRINIGEVLVRVSRQLNETSPHYAKMIMHCLLDGCRDTEELMRMSSLSNIGELSRGLGDSLGIYILDILDCVAIILEQDSVEVKSAAVELLRNALAGQTGPKVESIQRELRTIYGLLKKVKQRSLDENLCLQVELALEELNRLAKELLYGADKDKRLVKEIKVLSLLD